jgi:hypothetical protein
MASSTVHFGKALPVLGDFGFAMHPIENSERVAPRGNALGGATWFSSDVPSETTAHIFITTSIHYSTLTGVERAASTDVDQSSSMIHEFSTSFSDFSFTAIVGVRSSQTADINIGSFSPIRLPPVTSSVSPGTSTGSTSSASIIASTPSASPLFSTVPAPGITTPSYKSTRPQHTLSNTSFTTDTMNLGPIGVTTLSIAAHKLTLSPTAIGGIAAAATLAVVAIIAAEIACILLRKKRLQQGYTNEELAREHHHKERQKMPSDERVELAANGISSN